MQKNVLIETTGYIKKEATLTTVESNIIPGTFVLENSQPFTGYHGKNLPEDSRPRSLFLIVNKNYSFEEIARITKKIKQRFKYDFHASIGKIFFKTSTLDCIRIKYLKSFIFLPELQDIMQKEGIKFAKQKHLNKEGIIVVRKNFYIKEIQDNIYDDLEENSKFYIDLPQAISWENFIKATAYIKNNIDNSNFSVAQGVFYRKKGIVEVVRLYICEGEKDKLNVIREMYINYINKNIN